MEKGKKIKSETFSSWHVVFSNDSSHIGIMFGGKIMALMDITSAMAASRFSNRTVVTASVESLDFIHAVKVGDNLEITGKVVYSGGANIIVKTKVFTHNFINNNKRFLCTEAYFNFVALNEAGKPTVVPLVMAQTDEEKTEYEKGEKIKKTYMTRKKVK